MLKLHLVVISLPLQHDFELIPGSSAGPSYRTPEVSKVALQQVAIVQDHSSGIASAK
jgi:hypothetical protein